MNEVRIDSVSLAGAVARCRARAGFLQALQDVLTRVDSEITARGLVCLGGGACCRFDVAGHRLFASTGELALLSRAVPADPARCEHLRCPYQLGPRCTTRDVRPLGCRVFFCRRPPEQPPDEMYERFHRQIRNLHDHFAIPYAYGELITAMRELLAPQ